MQWGVLRCNQTEFNAILSAIFSRPEKAEDPAYVCDALGGYLRLHSALSSENTSLIGERPEWPPSNWIGRTAPELIGQENN
jgi:hypothetical protein